MLCALIYWFLKFGPQINNSLQASFDMQPVFGAVLHSKSWSIWLQRLKGRRLWRMRSSVLSTAACVEQKESLTSWRRPGKLSPVIPMNRLQFLYPEANLLDHLVFLLQQDFLAQSYFFVMLCLILSFHCLLNVLICTELHGHEINSPGQVHFSLTSKLQ